MPASRSTSRSASRTSTERRGRGGARQQVLAALKEDHARVKKAYKQFEKLDKSGDLEACETIVQQVLDELTLHAALEEDFLYPVAKEAMDDTSLIDEAEVEHESMHTAIEQLRDLGAEDDKYAARFTVLCEYVLHHVKEEEGEMFPQLEKLDLDWDTMAEQMQERRDQADGGEMLGEQAAAEPRAASQTGDDDDAMDDDQTGQERRQPEKARGAAG